MISQTTEMLTKRCDAIFKVKRNDASFLSSLQTYRVPRKIRNADGDMAINLSLLPPSPCHTVVRINFISTFETWKIICLVNGMN